MANRDGEEGVGLRSSMQPETQYSSSIYSGIYNPEPEGSRSTSSIVSEDMWHHRSNEYISVKEKFKKWVNFIIPYVTLFLLVENYLITGYRLYETREDFWKSPLWGFVLSAMVVSLMLILFLYHSYYKHRRHPERFQQYKGVVQFIYMSLIGGSIGLYMMGNVWLFNEVKWYEQSSIIFETATAWVFFGYILLLMVIISQIGISLMEQSRRRQLRDGEEVSIGLTSAQIDKIPVSKATDSLKEEICPICLLHYHKGMEVKMLPCDHVYHEACINEWLKKSDKCPICNNITLQTEI